MRGIDAEKRSRMMRAVGKRDTSPELRVRSVAHRLGYRFRLHRQDLPGTPDLVFPRLGVALFVHGCFWHQHADCHLANHPRTNLKYWGPKLRRNVERDFEARRSLEALGWTVRVVWECETGVDELEEVVRRKLGTR